jgi:GNAT superfamily N-acetyltransferase
VSTGGGDWILRPLRPEDLPVAERLSAEAYYDLDRRTRRASGPDPELRPAARAGHWLARTEHLVRTDPGGSWVAEGADGMLGFATSFRRELTWCLASFAVRPGRQGQGIGRLLLEAALSHSRGCLRGLLSASEDPRAVRRYLLAGFELHPQMFLFGTVDRSVLPVVEKVREGSAGDVDLMDSVDRRTRGSAHGPDHQLMLGSWRLIVSDSSTGSGYAYVSPDRLELLAATNRRTAARLLWAVLADAEGDVLLPHVTAANPWVIQIGTAARLALHQGGYLGVRGMKPPSPYVHNGALL